MSKPDVTFIERCLSGGAFADDLDDVVEEWHTGNATCSLAEFLGLTDDEYAIMVHNPNALKPIIYGRRHQVPLVEALEWSECTTMAARAASQNEAKKILQWLKKTKRVL